MTDTLYITDLDGTLLNGDKRISDRSAAILNDLIARGEAISVASARSLFGLHIINIDAVHFNIPLILMNGVLLYDAADGHILDCCFWEEQTASRVLEFCAAAGKTPFLYSVDGDRIDVTVTELTTDAERLFFRERENAFPGCFRQAEQYSVRNVVYLSMQDSYEVLSPLRERLLTLPDVACALYPDNYLEGNWYLEVFSARAGKDNGLRRLRERFGAKRVVAFGDNLNDLPMLRAADVACVVANGGAGAKEAADIVIGSNEDDGVAEFILQESSKNA